MYSYVHVNVLLYLVYFLLLLSTALSVTVVIDPQWVTLAETAATGATVFGILNPASGPGTERDESYPDVIDYVTDAGAKVMNKNFSNDAQHCRKLYKYATAVVCRCGKKTPPAMIRHVIWCMNTTYATVYLYGIGTLSRK